jgi:hypothetical protein
LVCSNLRELPRIKHTESQFYYFRIPCQLKITTIIEPGYKRDLRMGRVGGEENQSRLLIYAQRWHKEKHGLKREGGGTGLREDKRGKLA